MWPTLEICGAMKENSIKQGHCNKVGRDIGKMCIKRWGSGDEGYENTVACRREGGKSKFYGKNHMLADNTLCGLMFILNCGILQALPIQTVSSLALDSALKIK